MATVVQKYGGSSVADAECLRAVAGAVVDRWRGGDRVVVVVSAMGKTTDALIAQAQTISPEPSQRELDMLVSAGERISMALLSMAIHEAGGDSISFTGSQSGIITDTSHQGARILEVRPIRVVEELDRGRIVIVAGYQGVSREKEITTLGRGGTDTTAVAMAAALGAEACEIYSDVDGVYSTDPNLSDQARLLSEVSYETMQAIAGAGARVLNADAVEFAKRAGIAVFARKTGDPSGRETVVSTDADEPSGVVAVVHAGAVTRLRGAVGVPELLEAIREANGRVMTLTAAPEVDVLVDRTGIPGKNAAPLRDLAQELGLAVTDVEVTTLVGSGLACRPECWRAVAGAITPLGWIVGANRLHLVLADGDGAAATKMLHDMLVD